jgi:hypothetical protein
MIPVCPGLGNSLHANVPYFGRLGEFALVFQAH